MARRATSLGTKPSLCLFFCFVFLGGGPFLSWLLIENKPVYPPRKGHFLFIFESPPLFPSAFLASPFFIFFVSLSLSSQDRKNQDSKSSDRILSIFLRLEIAIS